MSNRILQLLSTSSDPELVQIAEEARQLPLQKLPVLPVLPDNPTIAQAEVWRKAVIKYATWDLLTQIHTERRQYIREKLEKKLGQALTDYTKERLEKIRPSMLPISKLIGHAEGHRVTIRKNKQIFCIVPLWYKELKITELDLVCFDMEKCCRIDPNVTRMEGKATDEDSDDQMELLDTL